MAYDEGLAERLRDQMSGRYDVVEKKMFGGLCFMVAGHMCCGVLGDELTARVGPANYGPCLAQAHAREMDFTGKPLKGMIFVSPEGLESDEELSQWLSFCVGFVEALPPKKGI